MFKISILISLATTVLFNNTANFFVDNNNFFKKIPNIRRTIKDDSGIDTGLYYATKPNENGISEIYNDYQVKEELNINDSFGNVSECSNPFEGDIFISNKDFLYKYYYNLSTNMPENVLGICGYTALSMLLSFYDTYWNDCFIDEKYESNRTKITKSIFENTNYNYESPGVLNTVPTSEKSIETIKAEIGYDDKNITDTMRKNFESRLMERVYAQIDNDTFLGKLFSISINNGYIRPRFDRNGNENLQNNYVEGLGVYYEVTNDNLQSYIESNQKLNSNVEIVTSRLRNTSQEEKTRIRNEIIEIVKSGRPAFVGGNWKYEKKQSAMR